MMIKWCLTWRQWIEERFSPSLITLELVGIQHSCMLEYSGQRKESASPRTSQKPIEQPSRCFALQLPSALSPWSCTDGSCSSKLLEGTRLGKVAAEVLSCQILYRFPASGLAGPFASGMNLCSVSIGKRSLDVFLHWMSQSVLGKIGLWPHFLRSLFKMCFYTTAGPVLLQSTVMEVAGYT